MTVRAEFRASLRAIQTPTTVNTVKADDTISTLFDLSSGTGTDQADLKYFARRTLAAATSENLDLRGVLLDQFGNTLSIAKVKAIMISNPSTNDGVLTIGGAASNAWTAMFTGTIDIPIGGCILIGGPKAGEAVTAGTADILKVLNNGTASVDYDILIIGTSV